jgi:hypothetical protein
MRSILVHTMPYARWLVVALLASVVVVPSDCRARAYTQQQLLNALSSLPDIARADTTALRELDSALGMAKPTSLEAGEEVATSAKSFGLPSEAVLVQGIIQFLVTRAQSEAVLVYQERLESSLEGSKLKCLLPSAASALSNLVTRPTRAGLGAIGKAFAADMSMLSTHLAGDEGCGIEVDSPFLAALRVYEKFRETGSASDALRQISDHDKAPLDLDANLSTLLTAHDRASRWGDLGVSLGDQLGIARASIVVQTSLESRERGQAVARDPRLERIVSMLAAVDAPIRSAPDSVRDDPQASARLLSRGLVALKKVTEEILHAKQGKIPGPVAEAMNVALQIEAAIVEKDWPTVSERLLRALTLLGKKPDQALIRTLEFASSIAQAKTPQEVSQALQAATLPAGSYRAKRLDEVGGAKGSWFGLNAYLGAGVARERGASGAPDPKGKSFGVFAPVGLEWTKRVGKRPFQSIGVAATMLNPGNFVQLYNQDGTTVGGTDVRLRDIVTPGVYLSVGLSKRMPLSLLAGYEFSGTARRDLTTGERFNTERYVLMLGIDMPLLRF